MTHPPLWAGGTAGPEHAAGTPGQVSPGPGRAALTAMMEARSVALVGASPRAGSLGERMVTEVRLSPAAPRIHLVNPRHREIAGQPCHPSLADVPGPVDLVLLGVADSALEEQVRLAADRGDRSAVIFGSAYDPPGQAPGLRARLAGLARDAGLALCGAGCMGFVNVSYGLRATGYREPDALPAGPIALITHSGSVFSAMLRSRRRLGYTIAVSSGQELVTTAADYAQYALSLPQTRVIGLVLEAMRDPGRLRRVLAAAAEADVPVVLLTAGSSPTGRALVTAHSGALAGHDGGWEALADAYGIHRVHDLAEFADTLEVFAIGRRAARPRGAGDAGGAGGAAGGAAQPGGTRYGIATVHDSGLERAHIADVAAACEVPFATIGERTKQRLAAVLDHGLEPANPLDMWGTSADALDQLTESLLALSQDEAVGATALAVDLVTEFDGDQSYPLAVLAAAGRTSAPLVVLCNIPGSIDLEVAGELRDAGIPVLESTRSGLLALRHLLAHAARPTEPTVPHIRPERRYRWARVLRSGQVGPGQLMELLRDYGLSTATARPADSLDCALAAAAQIGYPVVLKTDEPGIAHKSDVAGVILGVADPSSLATAYAGLATRLGPRVQVCQSIAPGVELALGITRDPDLGPLVVVGAGGVLVEHFADRAVALPPVDAEHGRRLVAGLRVARLLGGVRGQPPADAAAIATAVAGASQLACELGDHIEALDINPLICGPHGAVAVDALLVHREGPEPAPAHP